MQAAYINAYGTAQKLILGELDKPTIGPSQVLIKVVAAGVNPVDFHVRNGMLQESGYHSLPLVVGWDAAGHIVEIGAEVDQQALSLKLDDAVYVHSPINQQGADAEYLAVDAHLVAPKPTSLSFVESAAVPLAALTAWQGLFNDGLLTKGQRVLIHNASGGVGSFAVQIAKIAGAHVIATASSKKEQFVRDLGADEFIDYTKVEFEDALDAVDLVFAAVGGNDILPRSLRVLKAGGRLVSTFDELSAELAKEFKVTFSRMMVQPQKEDLQKISDLIEQQKISVTLDSVYPLEHAQQALERSESARAVGKIVLNIEPSIVR